MNRQCHCGHDHDEHVKPWGDTRKGEIAWCRHTTETIIGYAPKISYSSNYVYGQFANTGPQPSTIHFNYGTNPLPYIPNSYSNTFGAATYTTRRDYGSTNITPAINMHTGTVPITKSQRCDCVKCCCAYCSTHECAVEQAHIRAQNDRYEEQLRAANRQRQEREIVWNTGTFAQRREQRGVFRAILKTLKDVFVCSCRQVMIKKI